MARIEDRKRVGVALFLILLVGVGLIAVRPVFAATITLNVVPISPTAGQSITFSGTVTPPFADTGYVKLFAFSGCQDLFWVNSIQFNADSTGAYTVTDLTGLVAGSYSALAQDFTSGAISACVDFTVIPAGSGPPFVIVIEVPFSICVMQVGLVQQDGSTEWIGTGVTGTPISDCQNMTESFADAGGDTVVFHQFIMNGTSFKIVPIQPIVI